MNRHCAWCQKEVKFEWDDSSEENTQNQYICAECIIPLLPKTLQTQAESISSDSHIDDENRRIQRFPLLSQIYLSSEHQENRIAQALILDMSAGGMKLQIEHTLTQGEKITLGFFSRELIYKAIGEVVHVRPVDHRATERSEVGIKLIGIHQDLRSLVGAK